MRSARRPHAVVALTGLGLLAVALSGAASGAVQEPRTFTGVITDERCGLTGHAAMGMGPTDAACVRACADEHGDALVLIDGEHVYHLSDQKRPRAFAAMRVRVTGVLDSATETIRMTSIQAE